MLIEDAISGDRNVIKKEAEKIIKCNDLTTEIWRMWNVMPVKTGATQTISKSLGQYHIPGKHDIKELLKKNHIGNSTNTLESANIKVKVKCSRYRSGVAQRLGRGIVLLFHDRGTRRG